MVANILNVLTQAIADRRCIAIRYHAQRAIRVVEPHAIYTNDHGELVVDGYQTRGHSESGRQPPFWRPFRLKKITAISVLKERFAVRWEEGFSTHKLKYRAGLVAIVEERQPTYMYPPQALKDMGPFLPEGRRRLY